MNKSPFIADRAIPLYPSLALFLDYLPGVDDRNRRNKKKPNQARVKKNKAGEAVGIKVSQRGILRALLLVQVDHRLRDSAPTDQRLYIAGERRYYARTYAEWHLWDFGFMPYSAMVKAFQDLGEAGYIQMKDDLDFISADTEPTVRKRLLRIFRIYNRKAFSIDYDSIQRGIDAHAGVQEYFRVMFPSRFGPGATSDHSDRASDHSDQGVRSQRSDSLITVIGGSDHSDQGVRSQRSENHQSSDQSQSQPIASDSSSSSGQPLPPSQPAADFPNGETADPTLQTGDDFRKAYDLLIGEGMSEPSLTKLAQRCQPQFIQSWLEIKDYATRAKPDQGLGVTNWTGFLITVLTKHQPALEDPRKKSTPDSSRFTSGPYGREIHS